MNRIQVPTLVVFFMLLINLGCQNKVIETKIIDPEIVVKKLYENKVYKDFLNSGLVPRDEDLKLYIYFEKDVGIMCFLEENGLDPDEHDVEIVKKYIEQRTVNHSTEDSLELFYDKIISLFNTMQKYQIKAYDGNQNGKTILCINIVDAEFCFYKTKDLPPSYKDYKLIHQDENITIIRIW